ncbi:hypothetical protein [Mycobacteroides abscessus]|uniref:hypothetical protein n=1 Tax=Mycobacteroides abscessus TaxID=36809 RepID=UPI000929584A|nr:hypothetical protein [Mycobacteroides abscessus]SHQ64144.1 Uncharacterised protein [Mycobacteroides abscessus subsp. abscessus]
MFYDTTKFYSAGRWVRLEGQWLGVIDCASEDEAKEAADALNADSVAGRIVAENAALEWAAERPDFLGDSDSVCKLVQEGTRKLINDLLSQPRQIAEAPAEQGALTTTVDLRQVVRDKYGCLSGQPRYEGKHLAALIAVLLVTWPIEGNSRRQRRERRRRDRVIQLLREGPYRQTRFAAPPEPLGWRDVRRSWRSKLNGTSRKMADVEHLCWHAPLQVDMCLAAIGLAAEAVHTAMRLPVWRDGEIELVGHHVDLEAQLTGFTRTALDLAAAAKRVASEKPRGYATNITALRQLYETTTPTLEEAWAALVERLEALLGYTEKLNQMQQFKDQGARTPRMETLQNAADELAEANAAHALGAAELRNATLFADEYLQSRRQAQDILRLGPTTKTVNHEKTVGDQ